MTIMDSIYARRTVQAFTSETVTESALHALLYAAVQAPTLCPEADALGFAVITDIHTLSELSQSTGRLYNAIEDQTPKADGELLYVGGLRSSDLTLFHGGRALIVVYKMSVGHQAEPYGWMAAENLMLGAVGMGLGTALIGAVVDTLNLKRWKQRLDVPEEATAIAAIALGHPAGAPPIVGRQPPNILIWY